MGAIQNIFTQSAPAYLQRYERRIPKNHIKALKAIISCRTSACGLVVYDCTGCGHIHVGFRSCGNRHCPVCQYHKTRQWLDRQLERQMPGHHFLITFTIPEQLRRVFRSNQKKTYTALFAASSQTIKAFARDSKFIGGDLPGFFGVLHTWGRTMQYHPHIHYVVPGGAYSRADGKWHPCRPAFFAPVKAMSKVFRAKLRCQLKTAGLLPRIDPIVWSKPFNINSQAVAGCHSIKYLAPYVFKVAISDYRIIHYDHQKVMFHYKKPGSQRLRKMTVDTMEFIRRFLQHILPTGFMKIRYYGFMGPGSSIPLERIRSLIQSSQEFREQRPEEETQSPPKPTCPECGADLKLRCHIYYIRPLLLPDFGFG